MLEGLIIDFSSSTTVFDCPRSIIFIVIRVFRNHFVTVMKPHWFIAWTKHGRRSLADIHFDYPDDPMIRGLLSSWIFTLNFWRRTIESLLLLSLWSKGECIQISWFTGTLLMLRSCEKILREEMMDRRIIKSLQAVYSQKLRGVIEQPEKSGWRMLLMCIIVPTDKAELRPKIIGRSLRMSPLILLQFKHQTVTSMLK